MAYSPPLSITPRLITLVSEISELIGHLALTRDGELAPQLRRGNRIRTIQASLAIENNTLTLEQVTAVLDGKRVLGLPKEIQEVRNAFAAYEAMAHWQPTELDHLLQAHRLLMQGLIDEAGCWRQGGVGIYRGNELLHMAPPASRVPLLMADLLHVPGAVADVARDRVGAWLRALAVARLAQHRGVDLDVAVRAEHDVQRVLAHAVLGDRHGRTQTLQLVAHVARLVEQAE